MGRFNPASGVCICSNMWNRGESHFQGLCWTRGKNPKWRCMSIIRWKVGHGACISPAYVWRKVRSRCSRAVQRGGGYAEVFGGSFMCWSGCKISVASAWKAVQITTTWLYSSEDVPCGGLRDGHGRIALVWMRSPREGGAAAGISWQDETVLRYGALCP